jgi:hypothetical protein
MLRCYQHPVTEVLRFGIPALYQFVIPFVDFVDPFVIILLNGSTNLLLLYIKSFTDR